MLEVDDDRQRDAGIVRPSQNRAGDDRRPGIEVLVHAVGALCRHRSLPAFVAPADYDTTPPVAVSQTAPGFAVEQRNADHPMDLGRS